MEDSSSILEPRPPNPHPWRLLACGLELVTLPLGASGSSSEKWESHACLGARGAVVRHAWERKSKHLVNCQAHVSPWEGQGWFLGLVIRKMAGAGKPLLDTHLPLWQQETELFSVWWGAAFRTYFCIGCTCYRSGLPYLLNSFSNLPDFV